MLWNTPMKKKVEYFRQCASKSRWHLAHIFSLFRINLYYGNECVTPPRLMPTVNISQAIVVLLPIYLLWGIFSPYTPAVTERKNSISHVVSHSKFQMIAHDSQVQKPSLRFDMRNVCTCSLLAVWFPWWMEDGDAEGTQRRLLHPHLLPYWKIKYPKFFRSASLLNCLDSFGKLEN